MKLKIGDTVQVRLKQDFKPIRTEEEWHEELMKSLGFKPMYDFEYVIVTPENIEELKRTL